jgi:hypothetical protein
MLADIPSGSYNLGLNLPDGRSTSVSFPVIQAGGLATYPQLVLSSITPTFAVKGGIGLSLDLLGSRFLPGSSVLLVETQVLNVNELKCSAFGASLLSRSLSVQVSNVGVGGSTSAVVNLPLSDPHIVEIDHATTTFGANGGSARVSIRTGNPNDF